MDMWFSVIQLRFSLPSKRYILSPSGLVLNEAQIQSLEPDWLLNKEGRGRISGKSGKIRAANCRQKTHYNHGFHFLFNLEESSFTKSCHLPGMPKASQITLCTYFWAIEIRATPSVTEGCPQKSGHKSLHVKTPLSLSLFFLFSPFLFLSCFNPYTKKRPSLTNLFSVLCSTRILEKQPKSRVNFHDMEMLCWPRAKGLHLC